MKKILPLIALTLISCVSYKPVYLDLSMLMMEGPGEGKIVRSNCIDGTVFIETEKSEIDIEVRFDGIISSQIKNALCNGHEYVFSSNLRPDGPIEHLMLFDDKGLLAYLGDGLRTNIPGIKLEIDSAKTDEDCINLKSSEGQWKVKPGKPEKILIDGVEFSAYLLNTQRGDPQFDQPPFKADLILIRK